MYHIYNTVPVWSDASFKPSIKEHYITTSCTTTRELLVLEQSSFGSWESKIQESTRTRHQTLFNLSESEQRKSVSIHGRCVIAQARAKTECNCHQHIRQPHKSACRYRRV